MVTKKQSRCKSIKRGEKKYVQLDVLALSLHIAAGECALKNYLVVQVEEKRSPSVGEESALKTDTSFSSMEISYSSTPGQHTERCMEEDSKQIDWLRSSCDRYQSRDGSLHVLPTRRFIAKSHHPLISASLMWMGFFF